MLVKLCNIRSIYTCLFTLFCVSIPFTDVSKAIPNILIGVLAGLFFFLVKKEDFLKIQSKWLYLLGLMIVFGLSSIFIFQRWDDIDYMIRLITIIAIVVISLPVKDHILPVKAFVLSSLSLLLMSSVKIILYVKNSGSFDFTLGEHINTLLLGERPYLGMIYVASACLCWFLANNSLGVPKILWYFISLVFVGFVLIITARMALISLVIILFALIFYSKKRLKTSLAIVGTLLILGFLLFSFNENLKKRFYFSTNKDFVLSERLVHEPRYHIWECASGIEQTPVSFLFGKGFEQTETELVSCYQTRDKFNTEDQKQWFVRERFNTHNQYIEVYYAMGIIAFVCFIGFLFFLLTESRKNYYATALVLLLALFLFSENLIHRQIGVGYIGLVLVFSRFLNREKE